MGLLDIFLATPGPVLRGERLMLRVPRMRDYEEWRHLREESREFLMPWEPLWTADELSRKAYRQRLGRYVQEAQERTGFTFFLKDREDDRILGGLTLGQIRRGVAQCCTLGYWMGLPHAGRGLMHEAVDILKPFVFEVEGLHRIEAACLPANERSIRLLEKAGFRREGYLNKYLKIAGAWEDHYLYSLVADDWAAARAGDAPRRAEAGWPPVEAATSAAMGGLHP